MRLTDDEADQRPHPRRAAADIDGHEGRRATGRPPPNPTPRTWRDATCHYRPTPANTAARPSTRRHSSSKGLRSDGLRMAVGPDRVTPGSIRVIHTCRHFPKITPSLGTVPRSRRRPRRRIAPDGGRVLAVLPHVGRSAMVRDEPLPCVRPQVQARRLGSGQAPEVGRGAVPHVGRRR